MVKYYRKKSKEEIFSNMSSIRSSGTKIEVLMGRALWSLGLRYRKNYKKIIGKPDFAFPTKKYAVFCDSSFWHGRNWGKDRKSEFRKNKAFWIKKIENNIKRDKLVNQTLKGIGWKVFRFWDDEIINNSDGCAKVVFNEIRGQKG